MLYFYLIKKLIKNKLSLKIKYKINLYYKIKIQKNAYKTTQK